MFQHVLSLILLSILFFCHHFPGPCLPGPATPDFKDQPTCFLWLKLSASQSPGRPLAPEVPDRTCRGHIVLGPLCLLAASVPGELLGETYHFWEVRKFLQNVLFSLIRCLNFYETHKLVKIADFQMGVWYLESPWFPSQVTGGGVGYVFAWGGVVLGCFFSWKKHSVLMGPAWSLWSWVSEVSSSLKHAFILL